MINKKTKRFNKNKSKIYKVNIQWVHKNQPLKIQNHKLMLIKIIQRLSQVILLNNHKIYKILKPNNCKELKVHL